MQCYDRAWIEYREKTSEAYDDLNYSSPIHSLVMRASHRLKVRLAVQTANSLNSPDGPFDRLVATPVLEHIYQPHLPLKEWYRVLT